MFITRGQMGGHFGDISGAFWRAGSTHLGVILGSFWGVWAALGGLLAPGRSRTPSGVAPGRLRDAPGVPLGAQDGAKLGLSWP